jgi:hypothetical protein
MIHASNKGSCMDEHRAAGGSARLVERTPGARNSRSTLARRAVLVLATLAVATPALAARADAYIYWTNPRGDTIGRANLDGTAANPSFITGAHTPLGIAVDGTHIYWANSTNTIGRSNLDGTGANQSFIAPQISNRASGVAVDDAHIYWVSKFSDPHSSCLSLAPGTGAIGRANLDGTGADVNFITGISFPAGGITIDGSHLYWTSYDPLTRFCDLDEGPPLATRIGRANLDGTGVGENFIGAPAVTGVAVDDTHLWWVYADRFDRGIMRADLDGTGAERIVGGKNSGGCGIAVDDTHVYWTEEESIGRARLDGSRPTHKLITTARRRCGGVAVDALGPPPSNKFRFGGVRVNKKRGSAKLTVNVPGPGQVKLAKSTSVKGKRKWAEQSGKKRLSVKVKGKAKKRLNERGKTKVKAKIIYTPDGGTSATKGKKIKLVKR